MPELCLVRAGHRRLVRGGLVLLLVSFPAVVRGQTGAGPVPAPAPASLDPAREVARAVEFHQADRVCAAAAALGRLPQPPTLDAASAAMALQEATWVFGVSGHVVPGIRRLADGMPGGWSRSLRERALYFAAGAAIEANDWAGAVGYLSGISLEGLLGPRSRLLLAVALSTTGDTAGARRAYLDLLVAAGRPVPLARPDLELIGQARLGQMELLRQGAVTQEIPGLDDQLRQLPVAWEGYAEGLRLSAWGQYEQGSQLMALRRDRALPESLRQRLAARAEQLFQLALGRIALANHLRPAVAPNDEEQLLRTAIEVELCNEGTALEILAGFRARHPEQLPDLEARQVADPERTRLTERARRLARESAWLSSEGAVALGPLASEARSICDEAARQAEARASRLVEQVQRASRSWSIAADELEYDLLGRRAQRQIDAQGGPTAAAARSEPGAPSAQARRIAAERRLAAPPSRPSREVRWEWEGELWPDEALLLREESRCRCK